MEVLLEEEFQQQPVPNAGANFFLIACVSSNAEEQAHKFDPTFVERQLEILQVPHDLVLTPSTSSATTAVGGTPSDNSPDWFVFRKQDFLHLQQVVPLSSVRDQNQNCQERHDLHGELPGDVETVNLIVQNKLPVSSSCLARTTDGAEDPGVHDEERWRVFQKWFPGWTDPTEKFVYANQQLLETLARLPDVVGPIEGAGDVQYIAEEVVGDEQERELQQQDQQDDNFCKNFSAGAELCAAAGPEELGVGDDPVVVEMRPVGAASADFYTPAQDEMEVEFQDNIPTDYANAAASWGREHEQMQNSPTTTSNLRAFTEVHEQQQQPQQKDNLLSSQILEKSYNDLQRQAEEVLRKLSEQDDELQHAVSVENSLESFHTLEKVEKQQHRLLPKYQVDSLEISEENRRREAQVYHGNRPRPRHGSTLSHSSLSRSRTPSPEKMRVDYLRESHQSDLSGDAARLSRSASLRRRDGQSEASARTADYAGSSSSSQLSSKNKTPPRRKKPSGQGKLKLTPPGGGAASGNGTTNFMSARSSTASGLMPCHRNKIAAASKNKAATARSAVGAKRDESTEPGEDDQREKEFPQSPVRVTRRGRVNSPAKLTATTLKAEEIFGEQGRAQEDNQEAYDCDRVGVARRGKTTFSTDVVAAASSSLVIEEDQQQGLPRGLPGARAEDLFYSTVKAPGVKSGKNADVVEEKYYNTAKDQSRTGHGANNSREMTQAPSDIASTTTLPVGRGTTQELHRSTPSSSTVVPLFYGAVSPPDASFTGDTGGSAAAPAETAAVSPSAVTSSSATAFNATATAATAEHGLSGQRSFPAGSASKTSSQNSSTSTSSSSSSKMQPDHSNSLRGSANSDQPWYFSQKILGGMGSSSSIDSLTTGAVSCQTVAQSLSSRQPTTSLVDTAKNLVASHEMNENDQQNKHAVQKPVDLLNQSATYGTGAMDFLMTSTTSHSESTKVPHSACSSNTLEDSVQRHHMQLSTERSKKNEEPQHTSSGQQGGAHNFALQGSPVPCSSEKTFLGTNQNTPDTDLGAMNFFAANDSNGASCNSSAEKGKTHNNFLQGRTQQSFSSSPGLVNVNINFDEEELLHELQKTKMKTVPVPVVVAGGGGETTPATSTAGNKTRTNTLSDMQQCGGTGTKNYNPTTSGSDSEDVESLIRNLPRMMCEQGDDFEPSESRLKEVLEQDEILLEPLGRDDQHFNNGDVGAGGQQEANENDGIQHVVLSSSGTPLEQIPEGDEEVEGEDAMSGGAGGGYLQDVNETEVTNLVMEEECNTDVQRSCSVAREKSVASDEKLVLVLKPFVEQKEEIGETRSSFRSSDFIPVPRAGAGPMAPLPPLESSVTGAATADVDDGQSIVNEHQDDQRVNGEYVASRLSSDTVTAAEPQDMPSEQDRTPQELRPSCWSEVSSRLLKNNRLALSLDETTSISASHGRRPLQAPQAGRHPQAPAEQPPQFFSEETGRTITRRSRSLGSSFYSGSSARRGSNPSYLFPSATLPLARERSFSCNDSRIEVVSASPGEFSESNLLTPFELIEDDSLFFVDEAEEAILHPFPRTLKFRIRRHQEQLHGARSFSEQDGRDSIHSLRGRTTRGRSRLVPASKVKPLYDEFGFASHWFSSSSPDGAGNKSLRSCDHRDQETSVSSGRQVDLPFRLVHGQQTRRPPRQGPQPISVEVDDQELDHSRNSSRAEAHAELFLQHLPSPSRGSGSGAVGANNHKTLRHRSCLFSRKWSDRAARVTGPPRGSATTKTSSSRNSSFMIDRSEYQRIQKIHESTVKIQRWWSITLKKAASVVALGICM
ncbi:unnamed protein product [Amoebophrya sp. A120]|nr:unnamed protein product [Amoebophrya sp. A120]|eukprot:GSA120T00009495001.1